MTSFLQNSAVPAIWIISSLELLLIGYMVYRFIKTKSRTILFTACMTLGLFFDAFIIALESKVDASQMVVASRFRFIAHGLLIPLLFMISAEALELKKTPYLFLSGFLMFAFSALGPATGNSEYIFYISMYGELLMVIFLILHDMFGDRKKKKAENK